MPPAALFLVTPAGLLEWCDAQGDANAVPADLQLQVAAANPVLLMVRLASGERPPVDVQGDAQFANDINWLVDNLRWDLEADLARVIGTVPARQLAVLGAALTAGLRRWVQPAAMP
jgi:ubiquinone biosynthesis protein UbiJ